MTSNSALVPYTTDSGTGFNIQINWDSSVASAPVGFTADVEQVANFFASELQGSRHSPITINIDVGYGEINGSRIGNGAALGESETNLQQVSYSQLTSAYANSQLISDNPTAALNFPKSPPAGNFYLSDAEAQALGVITTTPTVDGYVGFSSQSGIFDYNTSGSVPNRQYDFEGTVAHEISEVLGRILLVGTNINHPPSYSAYDFFHYSGAGVQDFAANGGYFSIDQGTTNLGNFNAVHGGDAADWAKGGTSNTVGGSAYDAFNAFGTPGQRAPVTPTDLLVLQALGFQLSPAAEAEADTTQSSSGMTNTQTTVQNAVNSPPGNSPGLDHTVALFSQFIAAGFPEQHGGSITTNALSQVTTNEQQFLVNPHHG